MKVLVVVDMQHDFIDGSLGTPEAQEIVPSVRNKIGEAILRNDLIVYTRDTHFEDYLETKEGKKLPVEHCIRGTQGWTIPSELMPRVDYGRFYVYDKYTFGMTELASKIDARLRYEGLDKECTEIELVGLCTDICVVSNALLLKAAFYDRYEISVDATCCAGVTPETHEAALKTMEMCQINVKR